MVFKTRLAPRMTCQLQGFFRTAVTQNDITTIKRLVKHQRDLMNIDASNNEGICAIHQCAIDGNKKMMSLLLRAGADVNAVDLKGWTSLHACSAAGNFELSEYLLQKGADPMKYTENHELPIDLSIEPSITNLLADIMKGQGFGQLAQLHIIQLVKQQQQLKRRNSSPLENRNHLSNSILKRRHSTTVDKLSSSHSIRKPILKTQLTVGDMSSSLYNRNSLSSCSSYSSTSLSDESDESEVDSDVLCQSRRLSVQFPASTLFLNYVHENEYEMLDLLLQEEQVSILNKLDRKGLSTIHWAAINGFHECIGVLVKHGADVDIVDPNGWTPLHAAAITNKLECVEELLKNNASICALTNSGESVFDLTGDETILQVLKSNICKNVNTIKKDKATVL